MTEFDFLKKHSLKFVGVGFFFLIMIFLSTCGTSRKVKIIAKDVKKVIEVQKTNPTTDDLQKMLKIEGLKSELRMIQATDRKIFDVNRQNAIEEELKKLESSK